MYSIGYIKQNEMFGFKREEFEGSFDELLARVNELRSQGYDVTYHDWNEVCDYLD